MANAVVTLGQSINAPGVDVRTPGMVDSTKLVSSAVANEFVAGFPLSLDGSSTDQGKLRSVTDSALDLFYGACGTNVNRLRGETSLGETNATSINAYLSGIITVRKSTFLLNGSEVTICPFTGFGGTDEFPQSTDIGTVVDAIQVASEANLGSVTILKWGVGAGSSTGFAKVATIVDVREDSEVDLYLPGVLVNQSSTV